MSFTYPAERASRESSDKLQIKKLNCLFTQPWQEGKGTFVLFNFAAKQHMPEARSIYCPFTGYSHQRESKRNAALAFECSSIYTYVQ